MPKFNGGSHVDEKGYLRISAGPHRGRRVHDMIAEAMMGRELRKDEHAHHRDGNKLNCDWRNIEVLGERDHGAVSSRQYWYLKKYDLLEKAEWDEFWAEANRSVENHDADDYVEGEAAAIDVYFNPDELESDYEGSINE